MILTIYLFLYKKAKNKGILSLLKTINRHIWGAFHEFCEILHENFSKLVECFLRVGFRGKSRNFLENLKIYSPYSPAKRETPIYKGFARGSPSRDTHPDSHPGTHLQGDELRPKSWTQRMK